MSTLPAGIMKKVEEAVRANADANVTLLDAEGRYCYVGQRVMTTLGYSQEDLQDVLGQHFSLHIRASDLDHVLLAFQDALLNDESVLAPREVRLKSGGYRRMSGGGRKLVDEESGEIYVLIVARPIE